MPHNIAKLVRTATLGLAASVGIAGGASAQLTTGPISPYYLSNYVDHTIYVVQGTSVINSFPWSYDPGCTNFCEGNLAITGGHVNTNWFGNGVGSPSTAGQYTLNGAPTGVSWPNSSPPAGTTSEFIPDGTSDGIRNYTVENGAVPEPQVVATDLQWQNPTALFTVDRFLWGITYDPIDNALWIGTQTSNTISEYSLSGTLLKTIGSSSPFVAALAYDPADDTLWFAAGASNTLFQVSKTGVVLQSGEPAGLPSCGPFCLSYSAGEIAGAVPPPRVPEPASLTLLGTGLAGLWVALRRRTRLPA